MARLVTVLLAGLGLALPAAAESVGDPMRPPARFMPAAEATATAAAAAPGSVQMIRTINGRRTALVGGLLLRTGDRLGDARIRSIGSRTVTLEHADGQIEVLGLYPGVERRLKAGGRS